MNHQMMLGEFAVDPRDQWATPQYLFNQLHGEYNFTVDACALPESAKLSRFWSPETDGINQDWKHERVFCNPPYSTIDAWVEKCRTAEFACLLVPVSSDVKWWHSACRFANAIDFFRGRIQFVPPKGITASTCNGRHCLILFGGEVGRSGAWLIRSRDAKTGKLIT